LGEADVEALKGQTVCAVVYDSDLSVDIARVEAAMVWCP